MKQSNSNEIQRVYLFLGKVDSRRQAAVEDLIARVVDSESAVFDLEEFDGNESSADIILSAASMAPFTSEKKTVVVDRVDRLSAGDQSRIAGFIPKLGEKSCLILLAEEDDSSRRKSRTPKKKAPSGDDSEQKKQKKGLQAELVAAVKSHGNIITFAKLKSEGLNALVMKAVTAHGKKIQSSALQALAHSVEANPSVIDSEVEKLATYAAERETITLADVNEVATKSPEDRVFTLIDAIATRQQGQAIRLLNETLAASIKPDIEVLRILPMMAKHFRLLYQVKFLGTQGIRHLGSVPEELQSLLMQEHNPLSLHFDWQKKRLLAQVNYFTLDELQKCLRQVLSCELAAKGTGSGGSPRLNLEMLVLKLSQRK